MKLGTVVTGSGIETTINLTYLPSALFYAAGTQFTSMKVTVLGDGVILDLDSNGLSAIGKSGKDGNITDGYTIPLSDGIVINKNVEIVITNSAAQTPDIFGYSNQRGTMYFKHTQQKAFANSGVDIRDFALLCMPSFVAADELNIYYRNRTSQKTAPEDLRSMNSFEFAVQNDANDFYINNMNQSVSVANFIPNADQQIYISRFSPIGNQSFLIMPVLGIPTGLFVAQQAGFFDQLKELSSNIFGNKKPSDPPAFTNNPYVRGNVGFGAGINTNTVIIGAIALIGVALLARR